MALQFHMPLRRNRPASRVYVDAELELDPEEEELMEAALGRWIIVGSIRSVGMNENGFNCQLWLC